MTSRTLSMMAVGDLFCMLGDPKSFFALSAPVLKSADPDNPLRWESAIINFRLYPPDNYLFSAF